MGLIKQIGLMSVVACLWIPASPAYSGPDEVTDRLMDESASLFDVGMLRLELRLAKAENIPPTFSYYNWDKNQIVIWSNVFEDGWTLDRATQACDSWFTQVRSMAGVDISTGKLYSLYSRSGFADLFTHHGFTREINGKSTSEVAAGIDNKFSLTFTWQRFNAAPGEVSQLSCTGALIEKGYSTKEEKAEQPP